MIKQEFVIPRRLPGLNEVLNANRANRYKGAKLKKTVDETICWCIQDARLKPVSGPCIVCMTFVEGDRRRDVDNVESAKKFILDALVKTGILQGDSPSYVPWSPSYTEYGNRHKVLVTILEDDSIAVLESIMRQSYRVIVGGEACIPYTIPAKP